MKVLIVPYLQFILKFSKRENRAKKVVGVTYAKKGVNNVYHTVLLVGHGVKPSNYWVPYENMGDIQFL